jgi:hypothetical protein
MKSFAPWGGSEEKKYCDLHYVWLISPDCRADRYHPQYIGKTPLLGCKNAFDAEAVFEQNKLGVPFQKRLEK